MPNHSQPTAEQTANFLRLAAITLGTCCNAVERKPFDIQRQEEMLKSIKQVAKSLRDYADQTESQQ